MARRGPFPEVSICPGKIPNTDIRKLSSLLFLLGFYRVSSLISIYQPQAHALRELSITRRTLPTWFGNAMNIKTFAGGTPAARGSVVTGLPLAPDLEQNIV